MHEVASSQSLADAVLREAKKRDAARVLRVEIELGELSFLEPEQVGFWVDLNFQGTIAEGAELDIKLVEPVVSCRECDYAGAIQVAQHPAYHFALPTFRCPRCGSSRLEIERGRECTLRRIELELPENR